MKNARGLGKILLFVHLFVCMVWLAIFHWDGNSNDWMIHVFVWSIMGVQFTWGLTVGLLVGPSRQNRSKLWWSLLLVFMPLFPVGNLVFFMALAGYPILALVYLGFFVMILACETYCGVLLGAKMHAEDKDD